MGWDVQLSDVFDRSIFEERFNLTEKDFNACSISDEVLARIYRDYQDSRYDRLKELKNSFINDFILPALDDPNVHIHSFASRVKAPDHVIEKLVRKCSTNAQKYVGINETNYYKYLTDVIGVRVLLVYKKDWEAVNDYLLGRFKNDPTHYINTNKYVDSYDKDTAEECLVEKPKAYLRLGDGDPNDYGNGFEVVTDGYYRSLHYIVKYGEYCVEIQVRTLFEEAWGEVDHDVLYPYHKNDDILVGYSRLINRAAGMSDEMSTYLKKDLLPTRMEKGNALLDVPIVTVKSQKSSSPMDFDLQPSKEEYNRKGEKKEIAQNLLAKIICSREIDEK